MKFNTYLHFPSRCKEAMEFYARVFNGKIEGMMTFGESPDCEHMPKEMKDSIMHSCLMVGDNALMACDSPPEYRTPVQGFHVVVNTDTPAEAERIFGALSEGATIEMALGETFWALRFGMLVDRFGTPWMLNCIRQN